MGKKYLISYYLKKGVIVNELTIPAASEKEAIERLYMVVSGISEITQIKEIKSE